MISDEAGSFLPQTEKKNQAFPSSENEPPATTGFTSEPSIVERHGPQVKKPKKKHKKSKEKEEI
jgi:hypothetical protein